jgi:uncharacterized protein YcbX
MQERVHEQLLKPLRRCIRPHLSPLAGKERRGPTHIENVPQ